MAPCDHVKHGRVRKVTFRDSFAEVGRWNAGAAPEYSVMIHSEPAYRPRTEFLGRRDPSRQDIVARVFGLLNSFLHLEVVWLRTLWLVRRAVAKHRNPDLTMCNNRLK